MEAVFAETLIKYVIYNMRKINPKYENVLS
jgi:hypothetical protein